MNLVNCLSIPFYEFTCDEGLVNRIYNSVDNLNFDDSIHSKTFYDKELIDWFEDCIKQVQTTCFFNDELKLKVTACWANKAKKFQNGPLHTHINSILSGVFYLTNGSRTKFRLPNPYFYAELNNFLILSKNFDGRVDSYRNAIESHVDPEKGKLLIFPSSIQHRITTHTDNFTRYTIAFNTFPNGPLTSEVTAKLNIETKFE